MLLVSWGGNKSGDLHQYLVCTETICIEEFIAYNFFSNACVGLPVLSLLPILDSIAFET